MRELFFKCIGAILVLYTGAAMGWRKGNAAMRRVQVLADICAFLGAVRDDLHFRAAERRKSSLRHSKIPGCRRCRFIFPISPPAAAFRQSWTMRFAALNGKLRA